MFDVRVESKEGTSRRRHGPLASLSSPLHEESAELAAAEAEEVNTAERVAQDQGFQRQVMLERRSVARSIVVMLPLLLGVCRQRALRKLMNVML